MMIQVPWSDWCITVVDHAIDSAKSSWGDSGTQEIADITFSRFKFFVDEQLDYYKEWGLHIIGKWEKTPNDHYPNLNEIVFTHLFRIMPSLMNCARTLSKIPLNKLISRSGSGSISDSGSNSSSKTGTKDSTNTGSNDGTSRAAGENSPITEAPINSSPTDASAWNITNPSTKSGSQYNNGFENTLDEDTSESIEGEFSNTKESSTSESVTETDPLTYKEILLFNSFKFNVEIIARNFCKSLTEEYNTCY